MNRCRHVNILIRRASSSQIVVSWASAASVIGNLVLLERLPSAPMFSSLSSPPPFDYHALSLFQTVFGAVSRMTQGNPRPNVLRFFRGYKESLQ